MTDPISDALEAYYSIRCPECDEKLVTVVIPNDINAYYKHYKDGILFCINCQKSTFEESLLSMVKLEITGITFQRKED